jgi:hypothetical protein
MRGPGGSSGCGGAELGHLPDQSARPGRAAAELDLAAQHPGLRAEQGHPPADQQARWFPLFGEIAPQSAEEGHSPVAAQRVRFSK